jgi:hypothetical protein
MTEIYQALINLQTEFLRLNLSANFEIILEEDTYNKYRDYFIMNYLNYMNANAPELKDHFKLAGPGGYMTIRKS